MKGKLIKFRENAESPYVVEAGKEIFETIKGKWRETYFKNEHPITLELACGRGEYTVGLAGVFPQQNFIGVDIKGARIWKGSKIAADRGLNNVAFLRTQIDHLDQFFQQGEVDEIWIVFPDPQPRDRNEKKRLTHPRFIDLYKKVIKPGGVIRLKTDNRDLFDYTLEHLQSRADVADLEYTFDLYQSPYLGDHHSIQTKYEKGFLSEGLKINYLKFRIN